MRYLTIVRVDGSRVSGTIVGAGNGSDYGLDLLVRDADSNDVVSVNLVDVRSLTYALDACDECYSVLADEDMTDGSVMRRGHGYAHVDCAQDRDLDTRERAHAEVLAADGQGF